MKAANSEIAVAPFPKRHATTTVSGGFGYIDQRTGLEALDVVYGNDKYPANSKVYVMADAYAQPWANKIYKLADHRPEFILLPESFIKLYE